MRGSEIITALILQLCIVGSYSACSEDGMIDIVTGKASFCPTTKPTVQVTFQCKDISTVSSNAANSTVRLLATTSSDFDASFILLENNGIDYQAYVYHHMDFVIPSTHKINGQAYDGQIVISYTPAGSLSNFTARALRNKNPDYYTSLTDNSKPGATLVVLMSNVSTAQSIFKTTADPQSDDLTNLQLVLGQIEERYWYNYVAPSLNGDQCFSQNRWLVARDVIQVNPSVFTDVTPISRENPENTTSTATISLIGSPCT